MSHTRTQVSTSADGFSLIETIVAMGILATGLLSLAAVFTLGIRTQAGSSPALIAREKAREAIESVHTARDTGTILWAQIRNVADAGIFRSEARPLNVPGDDGLVNTADDGALETMRKPGPDHELNTADDMMEPLTNYTRQILITDLLTPGGQIDQNLRQIRVIVRYSVLGQWRTYTVTTYMSAFS